MEGRTVISENKDDFDLLDRRLPYRHAQVYLTDFSDNSFQALEKGGTKLIVVRPTTSRS